MVISQLCLKQDSEKSWNTGKVRNCNAGVFTPLNGCKRFAFEVLIFYMRFVWISWNTYLILFPLFSFDDKPSKAGSLFVHLPHVSSGLNEHTIIIYENGSPIHSGIMYAYLSCSVVSSEVSWAACPTQATLRAAWPWSAGSRCCSSCCLSCSRPAETETGNKTGTVAGRAETPCSCSCSCSCPGKLKKVRWRRRRRRKGRPCRRVCSALGCLWQPCAGETAPADGRDWEEKKRKSWSGLNRCWERWRMREMVRRLENLEGIQRKVYSVNSVNVSHHSRCTG